MRSLPLIPILVACGGHSAAPPDATMDAQADAAIDAPVDAPPGLPLGTVVATPMTCDPNAQAGATCTQLAVTCGGTTLDGYIAVSSPAGAAIGTITLHDGGAGTGYFGSGSTGLVASFVARGYRVVQLAWSATWQVSGLGARHAACLPATAYRWIYDNVHAVGTSQAFCGAGTSGGGATLGYALSAYGLDTIFDYAMIISGPAVAKMDVGCDVADYTGPAPAFCPEIPDPVTPLPAGAIDSIESTKTCSCTTPGCVDPAEKTIWAADSIVTAGASYAYPHTEMSFWFCGNQTPPNGSSGGGAFYYDAVSKTAGNDVSIHCYTGTGSPCSGEQVFEDPKALSDAIAAMTAGCTPRH
ncbi:MAG TPA: hypothetical protein VLX92_14465 [Kofleriaceae bacterium]|nr:hypothetical protein [Kofleriaceae bacterium]